MNKVMDDVIEVLKHKEWIVTKREGDLYKIEKSSTFENPSPFGVKRLGDSIYAYALLPEDVDAETAFRTIAAAIKPLPKEWANECVANWDAKNSNDIKNFLASVLGEMSWYESEIKILLILLCDKLSLRWSEVMDD